MVYYKEFSTLTLGMGGSIATAHAVLPGKECAKDCDVVFVLQDNMRMLVVVFCLLSSVSQSVSFLI